jgi:hypothetical protein
MPKPFLVAEGFRSLPRLPNPSLTGLHQTHLGEVKQIPQVSLILLPIPQNVHGDGMKPYESI